MNTKTHYIATGAVVLIAIIVMALKYMDYLTNPWTRDGQVRAEIIQITPRVSGPIVQLPIDDNQFVNAGDLLFEIDPRTFEAALEQARAQLDKTKDDYIALEKKVEAAQAQVEVSIAAIRRAQSLIIETNAEIEQNDAEYKRQQELLPEGATSQRMLERSKASYEVSLQKKQEALANLSQMQASLANSEAALAEAVANRGADGQYNAKIREAQAAVREAELNLEFTRVTAPVDGYITNLNLRLGSQAVANQPIIALLDVDSFWVHGFFRETLIGEMQPGDEATITLMTYPDTPLKGVVDSLGWGIAQDDGSTGFELLPKIKPTFEWIRLAQRIPVRIHLTDVPEEIKLRVGTTASVLVKTSRK